jgi:lysophospholipase L1-like esterase
MKGSRRGRARWKGLWLSAATTLLALAFAEIGFRACGPRAHRLPSILTADGREVPLADIANFLRKSGEGQADTGPRAQMAARLYARARYDSPRWSYFDAQGCITIQTNRLGFRDDEFEERPGPGELRILAVGDSFTFGSGVQGEDTWPQQLERMLQRRSASNVQVINAGFAGGHAPSTYAAWLESDGLALQPSTVIVGFCLNDMGGRVPMLAYPVLPAEPPLFGVSKLGEYVRRQARQRALLATAVGDYAVVVQAFPQPWEDTRRGLAAMQLLCRERGVRLVVAVFPMLSLLGPKYPYKGLHALVDAFLSEQGIEHLDLYPRFENRDERELWADVTDQHPNDAGQHIIAQGIRDWLDAHPEAPQASKDR